MFASIRKYKMEPDLIDELIRRVDEGFVPIISKANGFIGYYLIDGGNGIIASISIFKNQKGAEESNQMAAAYVNENLATILTNLPEVIDGEVKVSKT